MSESKMRYKLRKMGYSLKKGKDSYGCAGFMIISDYNNTIETGVNFTLSADDVVKFINEVWQEACNEAYKERVNEVWQEACNEAYEERANEVYAEAYAEEYEEVYQRVYEEMIADGNNKYDADKEAQLHAKEDAKEYAKEYVKDIRKYIESDAQDVANTVLAEWESRD